MNRRTYLAHIAAAVAAGVGPGCLGVPGHGTTASDDDPALAVGGTATVGGPSVRVTDARLAEAVFLDHDLFRSVEHRDGWQFVLADASTADVPLGDLAFSLVVDGESNRAEFDPTAVSDDGMAGTDENAAGEGTVGLPVPVAPASRAGIAVEYDGETATWWLDSRLVGRLDRVPAFAVHEAQIAASDEVAIRFAVENDGDRDGTFRALVAPADAADVDHPVAFDVPAGETELHEHPLDERPDAESVRVVSEWSADSRRFEYGPSP